MSTDAMRAEFERWFSEDGAWPAAIEKDRSGEYKLAAAVSSWRTWEAAMQHNARAALAQREDETVSERQRINKLMAEFRAHWVKANGEDSISVSALDKLAEVIAEGSYVAQRGDKQVSVEGLVYGSCLDLEMARHAADQARREGLIGMYPASCVVLDMALSRQMHGDTAGADYVQISDEELQAAFSKWNCSPNAQEFCKLDAWVQIEQAFKDGARTIEHHVAERLTQSRIGSVAPSLVERLRMRNDKDARDAASEIERLTKALAAANSQAEHFERGWYLRGDVLEKLKEWADAYRVDVFAQPRPEDWKRADALLAAQGMSMTCMSASNMRHVIDGVSKLVDEGLGY